MDYYSLLHVTPNFSESQLKQNYKTLVLRYHPDKHPGHRNKFEAVREAYKTLSDKKKKAEYDIKLRNRKVFFDTYFELLLMCVQTLQQHQKNLDIFLTIESELPFDDTKLHKYMKQLIFQSATCANHKDILYTVQTLLTAPEIKNHKRGNMVLKKVLKYVLSEMKRK